jgi:myosin heavy subunit
MSTVSKILVVIVLLLAAGTSFLEIAVFVQRSNYRAMLDKLEAKTNQEKSALQASVDQQVKDLTTKAEEVQRYKSENDNLTQSNETLVTEKTDLEKKVNELDTINRQKDDQLTKLQEKVDNMIREISALNEKMRRDADELLQVKREYERVVNSVTALQDKNNSLILNLTNVRRELEAAKVEAEDLRFNLRQYQAVTKIDIAVTKPTKLIRTTVLASNNAAGVILLAVGADDGIEKGMEFIIHRGMTYICKVRVENVLPDSCVARILTDTLASSDAQVNISDNAFSE